MAPAASKLATRAEETMALERGERYMETEKPEGTESTSTPGSPQGTATPTPGMVTVTATQDCNVMANGQSVTLAKGDTAEMTAEEAAGYANLGLVEIKGGGATAAPTEGMGVPKRK